MSINRVILIGRTGRNPETHTLNNDRKVVSFSLATSKRYKDRNGEQKEITDWHEVKVYGNTADFVEKYITSGRLVYVDGELHYRKFTNKAGIEQTVAEITAETVQLLDRQQEREKPRDIPARAQAPVEDFPEDSLPF